MPSLYARYLNYETSAEETVTMVAARLCIFEHSLDPPIIAVKINYMRVLGVGRRPQALGPNPPRTREPTGVEWSEGFEKWSTASALHLRLV